MRVFVTGAGGFVAGHLLPRLRAAGADVVAADREVDVTDPKAVRAALAAARPDAVVHLAAQSSDARSRVAPDETWRTNVLGTLSLLRAVQAEAPGARVLLVGSGVAYGSAEPGARPFAEGDPLRPRSPYAWSKAAADLLGGVFARRGLAVVRARPFNHLGPGQSDTFVAAAFARQIAEIEAGLRPPRLAVGNLDSVRDWLDVSDVVEAYRRLLDPAVPPGACNVASGRGLPVRAILDGLLRAARRRPEVVVDPARVRPTDVCVGDPARLAARTGWAPQVPLADTLAKVLDSWRLRVGART